ncbi:MAG: DUF3224 domain-containing protein [Reinekea sp.]
MSKTLTCTFSVADWQESEQWQSSDNCVTKTAAIKYHYTGDIQGESQMQMVLMYYPNGEAHFTALEHIEADVDGKRGGLVLSHNGLHSEKVANGQCELVFSTGELEGLRGHGSYAADASEVTLVLEII